MPLVILCDATTRVRFSDERASIDIDLRGSRTPREVGVEACRAHSRMEQEPTHPGMSSAFRWRTYFRRGGTAPLSIFVGRVALSSTSDLRAAAVLQLRRGLKSRSSLLARSAQDESKSAATEVRCGNELSLCSAACPSGTIYTSFWPDICAGLLGGTSVGWPPVRVRICRDQTTPLPG
ncbi:hypothetical protein THAOC_12323 [Thalassiosira oceanica]|uniref:Uncharacterized protein n=1 Tax=Thalassiosira oceanica TaxID=159749 RepID=K0T0E4_THAOC|nr:hypothetical protein THAOC_12323 [Thalassiosira oceanica]|eukprot:EJK66726.1 hypothetical protein THAOC_12323 [Thalassiosira oceanica]